MQGSTGAGIWRVRSAGIIIASLLPAPAALAQSGIITYVKGDVKVESSGTTNQALAGDEVNQGDLITTGPNGMAQLVMIDKARLALRSNSRLRIDKYPRVETDPPGSILFLVRGTLRSFTKLLTPQYAAGFSLQTRSATVGIRGSGNIMNQSDDDTTTIHHTIEGEHIITDSEGRFAPLISGPNQTVQVVFGQAPQFIATPPDLLVAGKTMVGRGSVDDDPPPRGADGTVLAQCIGVQAGCTAIVGANGLGIPVVDPDGNFGVDPLGLQSVALAVNGSTYAEQVSPSQLGLDAGALRSYSAYAGTQSGSSFGVQGGSATDVQTIKLDDGTAIVLGRWSGISGATFSGGAGFVNAGGVHWGYAGSGYPSYLSDALTGTVSYTRAGATTPTNQFGSLGQLMSAVLDINFTARTLNATLGISMPTVGNNAGGSWTLQAANVPIAQNSFFAFTGVGGLTVTNGTGQSSANNFRLNGIVEGSLVGARLNGALIAYGIVDQTGSPASFQTVSGVVAFQGPPQNAAAPYRDGLVSDPNGALNGASYIRSFTTTNRPDEVTVSGTSSVAAFNAPYVAGNLLAGHLRYAQGTSTVVDNGFDAATGLIWGRWAGGAATIGGQSASLANSSLHYIFSSTQSGPVSLPLTGTATYDVVGSTRPTDAVGHTGTLNSATLAANFTARTVNATVNIGINGQTWNGVANNMPIYRDQYFSAYGGSTIAGVPRPSLFTITCAPNCTPAVPSGSLDGFFTGRNGRGAGVMYNLGGNAGAIAFARRGP